MSPPTAFSATEIPVPRQYLVGLLLFLNVVDPLARPVGSHGTRVGQAELREELPAGHERLSADCANKGQSHWRLRANTSWL